MIKTFRNKGTADVTQAVLSKESRRLLPELLHRNALLKIAMLNRAKSLNDLNVPGLKLEKLRGTRKGQYSMRINQQFRICFEWRKDGVYNVEIVDYH